MFKLMKLPQHCADESSQSSFRVSELVQFEDCKASFSGGHGPMVLPSGRCYSPARLSLKNCFTITITVLRGEITRCLLTAVRTTTSREGEFRCRDCLIPMTLCCRVVQQHRIGDNVHSIRPLPQKVARFLMYAAHSLSLYSSVGCVAHQYGARFWQVVKFWGGGGGGTQFDYLATLP
jgi:hypothetical protein